MYKISVFNETEGEAYLLESYLIDNKEKAKTFKKLLKIAFPAPDFYVRSERII